MNSLYPLKFKPIFKDKIWGGQKIKTHLGLDFSPLPNCGEAWMISGIKEDQSVVENGFLAGNELNELLEIYMGDLVGEKVYETYGNEFPVLIKFLNSTDYLSVQVHPDNEMALKRHQCLGKSEMWYINQADENAVLVSGFNQKMNKELYSEHVKNNSIKKILNNVHAKSGDVYFIPAGQIHSLGPGLLLTEIQQTSDITYRIYDWDRNGDDGKPRELHVNQALDALDFNFVQDVKTHYQSVMNKSVALVKCPYFTTNILHLDKKTERDYQKTDSFVIYICEEGSFELDYQEGKMQINKSDCILLPSVFELVKLNPLNKAKILEVYID